MSADEIKGRVEEAIAHLKDGAENVTRACELADLKPTTFRSYVKRNNITVYGGKKVAVKSKKKKKVAKKKAPAKRTAKKLSSHEGWMQDVVKAWYKYFPKAQLSGNTILDISKLAPKL